MAKNRHNRIILGIGLGILVAVIVAGYLPRAQPFLGFKGKTLWDWLSLAGIPLSLASLGFWLQLQQQKRNDLQKQIELEQTKQLAAIEREQTEKLAAVEREIAEENRQEEALQNYFDKVSALLVEKNLLAIAAKGDTATPEEKELIDVSVVAIRAITLATLRRLDGSRKGSLIRFLIEAEVISRLNLSLAKADLIGADLNETVLKDAVLDNAVLERANLSNAHLSNADLSYANMSGAVLNTAVLIDADLTNADLTRAFLKKAILTHAILTDTILTHANMSGAILTDTNMICANISGADLTHADLTGADLSNADLRGADLRGAKGLAKEQLENKYPPYLCNTKLPEGIDIDPNRDCLKLSSTNEIESSHAAQEPNLYFTDTPPTTGRP